MGTIIFNSVYLNDYYTVVSNKENKKDFKFNYVIEDYYFGCKTFEQAEMKMQKQVIDNLLHKNKLLASDIDYLISGDLINQISISSYTARNYAIPFIGMYAACATFPLAIINGSDLIENNQAKNVICVTSSHNLTAERQYRYPVEYGATRPATSTITATGSVGAILSKKKSSFQIKNGTIGKVVDLGTNDVNHMGAVMAPACANTLHEHLSNLKIKPSYYDLIVTGDLGCVGLDILKDYYKRLYNEDLTNIIDAGYTLYKDVNFEYAGGSGPCCLPLILFGKIFKEKKYKKVLILGTGSLHSSTMVNQHESIPSVCHAVEIEVL